MLTWIIVIGFSLMGLATYLLVLLENNEDEKALFQRRLEEKQLLNEKIRAELTTVEEEIASEKAFLKQLIVKAKTFRNKSKHIDEILPELEAQAMKWEEFELTEEKALAQYKKWKKERIQHV